MLVLYIPEVYCIIIDYHITFIYAYNALARACICSMVCKVSYSHGLAKSCLKERLLVRLLP